MQDLYVRLKMFFLIIVSFVSACSTPEKMNGRVTSNLSSLDRMLHKSTMFGCNLQHRNNEEYCNCFAKIVVQATPIELKSRLVNRSDKESQSDLIDVMLSNRKKIDDCDVKMKSDFSIPTHRNSKALKDILTKYEGDILYPHETNSFDYKKLQKGYEYNLQNIILNADGTLDAPSLMKLTKIDQDSYYFSTIDKNGNIETENRILWKAGVMYLVQKSGGLRPWESDSSCKYVVGVCEYTTVSGKKEVVNSVFEKGVWIRSKPRGKHSRRLVKEVYDKHGMLLYQLNKSMGKWEKVRLNDREFSQEK